MRWPLLSRPRALKGVKVVPSKSFSPLPFVPTSSWPGPNGALQAIQSLASVPSGETRTAVPSAVQSVKIAGSLAADKDLLAEGDDPVDGADMSRHAGRLARAPGDDRAASAIPIPSVGKDSRINQPRPAKGLIHRQRRGFCEMPVGVFAQINPQILPVGAGVDTAFLVHSHLGGDEACIPLDSTERLPAHAIAKGNLPLRHDKDPAIGEQMQVGWQVLRPIDSGPSTTKEARPTRPCQPERTASSRIRSGRCIRRWSPGQTSGRARCVPAMGEWSTGGATLIAACSDSDDPSAVYPAFRPGAVRL